MGKGPVKRGIDSSVLPILDSPVWRMVHALANMTDPNDPDKVTIQGFYDNVRPPTPRDL